MARHWFMLAVVAVGGLVGGATARAEDGFDWDVWARIVVQDGGRMKPLETLAHETVAEITGRSSLRPEGNWFLSVADVANWPAFGKALTNDTSAVAARLGGPKGLLSAGLRKQLAELNLDTTELAKQVKEKKVRLDKLRDEYSETDLQVLSLEQLKPRIQAAGNADQQALVESYETLSQQLHAVDAAKAQLIREINELLLRRDFYDAAAWSGIAVGADARALLDKGAEKLTEPELLHLNRLLLGSAVPAALKTTEPAAPKDGTVAVDNRKYNAVELYVTWLLTWQGWDKLKDVEPLLEGRFDGGYWKFHQADAWDGVPMINARYQAMGPKLKPEREAAVAVRTIAGNHEFDEWFQEIFEKRRAGEVELSPVEEKAAAAFEAYMSFIKVRIGFHLAVGPNQTHETQDWMPLVALLLDNGKLEQYGAPKSAIEDVRAGFHRARRGLLRKDTVEFNAGSQQFAQALAYLGKNSNLYPTAAAIEREVHYNRFEPFLWATSLAALATVVLAVSLGVRSALPYYTGFGTLLAAIGMMVYGMYLRIVISGRPPVTNMYETLIWSSFVASALAVTLGLVYRHRIIPTTAALLVTLATLLAWYMPIEMGAAISPLMPVLRSRYWLIVHVMTIVASYGAFMLAWGLGNVGIVLILLNRDRPEVAKPMALFTYRAMQVGVLLLAAGTGLGGWWAADSWGRFWGWDPKEVWALVALLGYLVILHCRFVGWLKLFGLMAGAVLAFSGVVMAWYGVNFVLGAGLHAYAFGTGGLHEVMTAVGLNILLVHAAAFKRGQLVMSALLGELGANLIYAAVSLKLGVGLLNMLAGVAGVSAIYLVAFGLVKQARQAALVKATAGDDETFSLQSAT